MKKELVVAKLLQCSTPDVGNNLERARLSGPIKFLPTSEHLILIMLKVVDGGVGVAQESTSGLAAHSDLDG